MKKPGIDFLHLVFYKQPVYKQLALTWKIDKQLSGLNPLSLSNNKNYSLTVTSSKTTTSQNVSSEAQAKNFFISWKSYLPCS